MTLTINERVAQLEVRFDALERDQELTALELKQAIREVQALGSEMRGVSAELRTAIAAVATNAAKPFENLSVGWRVIAGIGTLIWGFAVVIGSIIGTLAYFRHH